MFSGIIENIGRVHVFKREANSARLQILTGLSPQLKVGDSVSVNGVCLTVVAKDTKGFRAQIAPETMRCTNLDKLRPGQEVNLELALKLDNRIGGHLVQGHVDGVGYIRRQMKSKNYAIWHIAAPRALMKYIVPKGSIAVEGVSLTIIETRVDQFGISLIPHTLQHTTLGRKKIGQTLNLEVDVLGKHVERLLAQ
jgi:riboflavin synthase